MTTIISCFPFLTTLQKIVHYFSKHERIGNYVKEINVAYVVQYQNNKLPRSYEKNFKPNDSDKNHIP